MTTFLGPLQRAANCFADRIATVDVASGEVATYAEFAAEVLKVGKRLCDMDVPPGGRVAVLADGSARYSALYLGIPISGCVIAPLNTRYTIDELEAACRDCEPSLLLTDRQTGELDHLATTVMSIHDFFRAPCAAGDAPRSEPREGDPAAIFYTGGTTDRAKGVLLSHRNKIADALSFISGFSLTSEDRWLVMSPMFHAAGSFNVVPCVWMGASQIFLERFDAADVLRAIERYRITMSFGVPTMLHALVKAQERIGADTSSLRLLGHGGAPITASLLDDVRDTFPNTEICATYGATEMAPLATIHRNQERVLGTALAKSVGIPVLGVDVLPVDDSRRTVPNGHIGELMVSGPNIMLGYWGKPEETARVLSAQRYCSGDLGYRDERGNIYVVDRSKDMIITGGEKRLRVRGRGCADIASGRGGGWCRWGRRRDLGGDRCGSDRHPRARR